MTEREREIEIERALCIVFCQIKYEFLGMVGQPY